MGKRRRSQASDQVLGGLQRMDHDVFESVAGADNPTLDAVLPRLTTAANNSKLWMGLAGAMALTRRSPLQRAAARAGQPGGLEPRGQPVRQTLLEA